VCHLICLSPSSPPPCNFWRSLRRWSHGLHSGAWGEGKKQQAQVEKSDAHTGYEEIPFHCENSGVVAQGAQGDCAASILGGF